MRKLRRLPWRIPKSHHDKPIAHDSAPATAIAADTSAELEREIARERERDMKPVAFTAGRYVYGTCAAPTRNTEVRRKSRHRLIPLPAVAIG